MSSWSQGTAPADLLGVDRVPKGCDTTDSDRALEQKARRAARRDRPPAAHRDRRWACRSPLLRCSRQPSGSATSAGAVLARLIGERAASDVGGAGALLCDIAEKQYCRSLWEEGWALFEAHALVAKELPPRRWATWPLCAAPVPPADLSAAPVPRPPRGPRAQKRHVWGRSSVESRPDRRWSRGVRPPPPWGRCTRLVRPPAAVGASCIPTAHAWS